MTWWSKQIQLCHLIRDYDRVAAKAGHSVGKTHGVAGAVIWFLHAFDPAIIVTTAPSTEQVINEIWMEIRKQAAGAKVPLFKGLLPAKPFWRVSPHWYATGFSTDKGDRFRGKHGPNMLFVFDEATGIPPFVWEETENMCTVPGNKILALGNPINPSGDFYDAFKSGSGWAQLKISCLDHPNVVHGKQIFPGAVSRQWVEKRIAKYCTPITAADVDPAVDFEYPKQSGQWYRPSATFMCRVLGEFPQEGPDVLITFAQVVYARTRAPIPIDELSSVDIGLDVAYQGGDACVLFARRGPCVIAREKWYGRDTEFTIRRTAAFCRKLHIQGYRVGTVAVDAIGIGSGVAAGLQGLQNDGELSVGRVLAIQVSEKAVSVEKYENQRAELAFALAERFAQGSIDMTRLGEAGEDFENQAPLIKWDYSRNGRYRIESKDKIRARIGLSPDDFDAMCLCFVDTADAFAENYAAVMEAAA